MWEKLTSEEQKQVAFALSKLVTALANEFIVRQDRDRYYTICGTNGPLWQMVDTIKATEK